MSTKNPQTARTIHLRAQNDHDAGNTGFKAAELHRPGIRNRLAKTMDKPPSLPTIRKYFNMDVLPDTPGEKLQKDKAFDVEPFRSAIIEVLLITPTIKTSV